MIGFYAGSRLNRTSFLQTLSPMIPKPSVTHTEFHDALPQRRARLWERCAGARTGRFRQRDGDEGRSEPMRRRLVHHLSALTKDEGVVHDVAVRVTSGCEPQKLRNHHRRAPKHAYDEIKVDYHRIVYRGRADGAR